VTLSHDVRGVVPSAVGADRRDGGTVPVRSGLGVLVAQVERSRPAEPQAQVVDLGLPALEQWCPGCAGAGSVHSAAWARWDEEHARLSVQAVDAWREPILQTMVSERLAELSARSPQEPRVVGCTRCRGLGVVPTAFGHSVLELVRRHLT